MAKDAKSRRTANLATPNDLGANATRTSRAASISCWPT